MLEIKVYYFDVLRYTVIGDWDKVHELQNRGYYVDVRSVPRSGLGMDNLRDHSSAFSETYTACIS